jgi:hypothetical protein
MPFVGNKVVMKLRFSIDERFVMQLMSFSWLPCQDFDR